MGTRAVRQVYDFEDEAGVVTAELKITINEAGIPAPVGADVTYHARSLMEEAEYHEHCSRLDDQCWSIEEFRKDIPEEMKQILEVGKGLSFDEAQTMFETMFEWLETLYHNKFRKVQ